MLRATGRHLLPEEDAIDDLDDDDEADPTVPGDLWYRVPAADGATPSQRLEGPSYTRWQ